MSRPSQARNHSRHGFSDMPKDSLTRQVGRSFTGSLTLHGVTKTVVGAVDVRQAGAGLRVSGSFPLRLSDYGIRPPRYLGIGVKDTVQVEVVFAVTHGDER